MLLRLTLTLCTHMIAFQTDPHILFQNWHELPVSFWGRTSKKSTVMRSHMTCKFSFRQIDPITDVQTEKYPELRSSPISKVLISRWSVWCFILQILSNHWSLFKKMIFRHLLPVFNNYTNKPNLVFDNTLKMFLKVMSRTFSTL